MLCPPSSPINQRITVLISFKLFWNSITDIRYDFTSTLNKNVLVVSHQTNGWWITVSFCRNFGSMVSVLLLYPGRGHGEPRVRLRKHWLWGMNTLLITGHTVTCTFTPRGTSRYILEGGRKPEETWGLDHYQGLWSCEEARRPAVPFHEVFFLMKWMKVYESLFICLWIWSGEAHK